MKDRTVVAALFFLVAAAPGVSRSQERVDEQAVARIKVEGFQHSQVMDTLGYLTDVYGPRLTGSPGLKAASDWCVKRLGEWGLQNPRLESWGTFGRGWSVERQSIEMTSPRYSRLIAYPHAWSPGIEGTLEGSPVLVEIKGKEDFDKYRGKLKGAIVLRGKPLPARSRFEPYGTRYDAEELAKEGGRINPGEPKSFWADQEAWDKDVAKEREIVDFFKSEDISLLIEPSERDDLVVHVAGLGYYLGTTGQTFPSFVMAKEHYTRILRLLDRTVPVTLEVSLQTKFYDNAEGTNVLADLPGSDPALRDEVVLLGAHLDSWHSGTGATDNGAGSAAILEAMRILKATGLSPRRTIRLGLWTGEEQGYFGSVGYVTKHFGDLKTMKLLPEHAKLAVYLNLDNGSGRIRGVYLQGNEAARPIFEAFLKPFEYLDATTITTENTGGTDHLPVNGIGLPGFQFIQDPLDYDNHTHHTNIDVLDNAIEDDLKQAAVIIASVAYDAAMRDQKFPRPPMPEPHVDKPPTQEN
jgi:carboxypeptidase Q